MKQLRALLGIVFLVLFSLTTVAQDKNMKRARQKVADKYEQMFVDLNFTEQQKEAVISNWAERNVEIGRQTENAEDPKAVRAAINKKYQDKLREEVGQDLLKKIREWQNENK